MTAQVETDQRRQAAVYRLFAEDGALLYIGSAYDPNERCKAHEGKPWWAQVARRTEEWHPSRGGAYVAEMRAIASEGSKHNLMGSPQYYDSEPNRRQCDAAKRRGKVQSRFYKIQSDVMDAERAAGATWKEAARAGEIEAFAYLESTGLFARWVEKFRQSLATE